MQRVHRLDLLPLIEQSLHSIRGSRRNEVVTQGIAERIAKRSLRLSDKRRQLAGSAGSQPAVEDRSIEFTEDYLPFTLLDQLRYFSCQLVSRNQHHDVRALDARVARQEIDVLVLQFRQ